MLLARLVLTAAFILACTLVQVPLMAQEKNELEELQDQTIGLLKKCSKATVAIQCKVPGEKPVGPVIPRRGTRRRQQTGGGYFGTGAVISTDGYILTSTSVVPPKGTDIKVFYHDGRTYKAKLVGCEEKNNVTLIKIDASGLEALKLGSSKKVRAGQLAFTIGNPYSSITNDRQTAFSMGVISGIYKLRGDGNYTGRVIETDAALNNGNDGGPLINAKGELIGILNLGYSYTKWLNIAVPMDQIKFILEDLKKGAEVNPRYGFIFAEAPGYGGGIEVTSTSRRGPARKAGIKRGDVILEIDGMKIERIDQLAEELSKLPPGSEVTFLLKRDDEELMLKLTSGKFVEKPKKPEKQPEPKQPEPKEPEKKEPGTMGVRITEDNGGLVISKITDGGAADEAGLETGDRLLEINGKSLGKIKDVIEALKDEYAGSKLMLLIERENEKKKIELTLKKKN